MAGSKVKRNKVKVFLAYVPSSSVMRTGERNGSTAEAKAVNPAPIVRLTSNVSSGSTVASSMIGISKNIGFWLPG